MPAKWAFAIGAGRRRARDYKVKWRTEKEEKNGEKGNREHSTRARIERRWHILPGEELKMCSSCFRHESCLACHLFAQSRTVERKKIFVQKKTQIQKKREDSYHDKHPSGKMCVSLLIHYVFPRRSSMPSQTI